MSDSSLTADPPSLPSTLTDLHLSEMSPIESEPMLPPGTVPFTELAPHARGGLGDVFRGTDPDLNRTVALKCLQERHADNSHSRRRFLLEAEITARLEHPGVVPVYELFNSTDRPAYAMRFVEGQTMAEAITAYHAGPPDAVAFRRLLLSFLQVCNTVAYAHSRGVIHRDLKPANIMLGKFGETLLLDWGLAKVVDRDEMEVTEPIASPAPEHGETKMGSAIGTPAYMSPEQAAGQWDRVAEPADVYSLGAVLYTVLTGRSAIDRDRWPEMQGRIQSGDFPRPRQVKPDVPPALEAICLKAMTTDPAGRYSSAKALAADVEHWMADEPVTAWQEPLAARARRWMRRHRTLVSAGSVLLVAAVVGLSAGAVLLERTRAETDRQRQAADTARKKAEALNRFLIDDLLKQADPVNNPLGDRITVRELLDKAAERLDRQTSLADQPEVEAELRAVIGHAYEYLSVFDKAERHYHRALNLRAVLHGHSDPGTLAVRNRFVFAYVAQGGRPDAEWVARSALADCMTALGEFNPETGDAANNLAEVYLSIDRVEEAVELRRRASRIMNETLGPNDDRTLEIDNNFGVALVMAGRSVDAAAVLQSVVDRRRVASPHHYEFGRNLGNLGGALVFSGRCRDAEKSLREAVKLTERSPDRQGALSARSLLAHALECQERWEEAETMYRGVLAERRAMNDQQIQLPKTLGALVRVYAKQRRWKEAVPFLAELLLLERPNPSRTLEELTTGLQAALGEMSEPAAAEPLLQECTAVLKSRLFKGDWLTAELESRRGDCLRRLGQFERAEGILTAAANDVARAMGAPAWGVAAARKRIADLYQAWKKPDEAAKWM
jgi:tetratricopeptide (TPR) repeat protein